jgi:decaprenylphospho-beta-D-ribofuranose 2-oxidase
MKRIRNSVQALESYSDLYADVARVYYPADVDQLREVFAYAKANKRRVTLRGGGHSFDAQSLGKEIVVSTERFDTIEVLESSQEVRVGAGATWGAIVAKLDEKGLVPAGTVTSSHATAGGTLSADCLSRFSPRYGKEASHVKRFSLLTIDGTLLECIPPPAGTPRAGWTNGQRAFMGAIGGFGYLGAVVDVTYKVLSVGQPHIGVETRIEKYTSFKDLARDLVPAIASASGPPPGTTSPDWDAIYAGLYPAGGKSPSWMLFTSKFTTDPERRRLFLDQRNNPIRIAGEWLMRLPLFCELISWCFFTFTRNGATYIDDLADFLFFMDANTTAKRIARRIGFKLKTVQQTFIVPVDPSSTGAEARLVEWLDCAQDLFRTRGLAPTLQDVLYLPEDLEFSLSPDSRSPGYAVSYAFETNDTATLTNAMETLTELADVLWNRFQGRVSLVKNVCVKPSTLLAMYGAGAVDFCQLKQTLDPDGLLRNDFLQRTFGTLSGCG